MAPTRSKKLKIDQNTEEPPVYEQPSSSRIRGKNFSLFENTTLLKSCDKFHGIINKNSNRNVDINNKDTVDIKHGSE